MTLEYIVNVKNKIGLILITSMKEFPVGELNPGPPRDRRGY